MLDVDSGAPSGSFDIEITASTNASTTYGTIGGTFAVQIPGSTEVVSGNAPPTIDWTGMTGFHNGAPITLREWPNITIVTTTFAVQDTNGGTDVSTTTIMVYRSDVGVANCGWGTTTDINHCYPTTSTLSGWEPTGLAGDICDRTSVSGDYAYFWCTTTLQYVADPTDTGSTYAASNWVVYASTSDLSWAQGSDTSTGVEMNTTQALILSTTTLNFPTLSAGADTGANWVTTTATSTGNSAIDIHFYGGSLTHETNDAYHIPAFWQQFTTTSGKVYGDAGFTWSLATTTGGTADGKTHDVTIAKATTTVPGPTAADQIYWGIGIPTGQFSGTYSSTTNFIATSTIGGGSSCGGQSWGGYCWYKGSVNESCTTVCGTHGGNVGTCQENDDTSCYLCKTIFNQLSFTCSEASNSYDPSMVGIGNACFYRDATLGDCSTTPGELAQRFCACVE